MGSFASGSIRDGAEVGGTAYIAADAVVTNAYIAADAVVAAGASTVYQAANLLEYDCEDGSGTTLTDARGNQNGTFDVINPPTWDTTNFKHGATSLAFAALTSDVGYVSIAVGGNYFHNDFGWEFGMWFRSSATTNGITLAQRTVSGSEPNNVAVSFSMGTGVSPTLTFTVHNVGAYTSSAVTNLRDGNWHHVVLRHYGSSHNIQIIVDDFPVLSATTGSWGPNASHTSVIGSFGSGSTQDAWNADSIYYKPI